MIERVGLLVVRIHVDVFCRMISGTSHVEAGSCGRLNLSFVSWLSRVVSRRSVDIAGEETRERLETGTR